MWYQNANLNTNLRYHKEPWKNLSYGNFTPVRFWHVSNNCWKMLGHYGVYLNFYHLLSVDRIFLEISVTRGSFWTILTSYQQPVLSDWWHIVCSNPREVRWDWYKYNRENKVFPWLWQSLQDNSCTFNTLRDLGTVLPVAQVYKFPVEPLWW